MTSRETRQARAEGADQAQSSEAGPIFPWLDRVFRPLNRLAAAPTVRLVLPLVIIALAAWLIRQELKAVSLHEIAAAIGATPPWALALSALCTLATYACVAVEEWYVLRFIGRPLPPLRTALASAGSSALSIAMGFGLASGTAVRLRLYAFAKLTAADVAKVTALVSGMLFLSGLVTEGVSTLGATGPVGRELGWPAWSVAVLAALLVTPAVGWFVLLRRLVRGHPTTPGLRGRMICLAAGVGEWVFSGAALFVLAAHRLSDLPAFLAAFCFGTLIGSAVGVPADLGVLEAAILGSGSLGAARQTAAALILYRLIFHLAPLMIATVLVGGRQIFKLATRRTATG